MEREEHKLHIKRKFHTMHKLTAIFSWMNDCFRKEREVIENKISKSHKADISSIKDTYKDQLEVQNNIEEILRKIENENNYHVHSEMHDHENRVNLKENQRISDEPFSSSDNIHHSRGNKTATLRREAPSHVIHEQDNLMKKRDRKHKEKEKMEIEASISISRKSSFGDFSNINPKQGKL